MNSSPPDHMNADTSDPENTWQQIFKSYSNQHHGFVDSNRTGHGFTLKIRAENDNKIV